MMLRRFSFLMFAKLIVLVIALPSFSQIVVAQFLPAPTPIADPSDTRFRDVTEDWTSPGLKTSRLHPVPAFIGYSNDEPGYTVELIQVQWRFGDPIDLYVMKPKGIKKPPVILYLYGYPSSTDRFKDDGFQKAVTKDGFAAVGFVSALTGHRYHDRPMREWFVSELQECLATSAHDVQMVLDYLATRDDLDMNRVGMFSQGSGASVGILTSAVDPRIKVLEALDPWGDWPIWMATSPFVPADERAEYVKPEFLKKVAGLEPVDWLPKIQAKKFRLDNSLFESNTPPAVREKLRAAAPAGTNIMIYKTLDDFKLAFQDGKNLEWIQHELESVTEPPASANNAPGLQ